MGGIQKFFRMANKDLADPTSATKIIVAIFSTGIVAFFVLCSVAWRLHDKFLFVVSFVGAAGGWLMMCDLLRLESKLRPDIKNEN